MVDQPSRGRASRSWARLIKKVFEVDPLLCPDCGGMMKIIAFIEELSVIRKILDHLDLWENQDPRPPPVKEDADNVRELEYVSCSD